MTATATRSATTLRRAPLAALLAFAGLASGMFWVAPDAAADGSRQTRAAQDRGEASMRIDNASWQAGSANARLRGTSLNVSAMHSNRVEETVITERLSLRIPDYRGPGQYAAAIGSSFVRAGIRIPKNADDSTEADSEVLTDALKGARMIRLDNAEVEIDSVDDGFVGGRFRLEAASAGAQPAISEGVFRARLRE
ncbi:hypothetical protein [Dokdonella immobilis]|uniref:Uncharacterized protein n=1 Tax=Dokdonella immobilis TaxID=578942 RepID=A0A1I4ZZ18_9GAMM|nr:hypothetical protein [Dokdonella immobilis]SFN55464.1 hypothetical protein SAMN05216289_13036 [Dokdonella immobilis]